MDDADNQWKMATCNLALIQVSHFRLFPLATLQPNSIFSQLDPELFGAGILNGAKQSLGPDLKACSLAAKRIQKSTEIHFVDKVKC